MVCCLKAMRCNRGLSKGKLLNSKSRDKRWDERDREASIYSICIYRSASVRKCCFRQTTEYEILSLMLPLLPTIARHSSIRLIYHQSTQSRFIFERLRAINGNQMKNRVMNVYTIPKICIHKKGRMLDPITKLPYKTYKVLRTFPNL